MSRALLVILFCVGLLLASGFRWALHRISPAVLMHDEQWPRLFPYPDTWIRELNDWYDKRYPAPPGTIKLHGELPRVRLTFLICLYSSMTLCVAPAVVLAVRSIRCYLRRKQGRCVNCGYDLRGNVSGVCPECGADS